MKTALEKLREEFVDGVVTVGGRRGFSIVCDVCDGSFFSEVKSEHLINSVYLVLCPKCQKDLGS